MTMPPRDRRRAVVVQLDLCGFTALAKEMGDPRELAELVQGLFAAFDAAVAAAGLARVETIGDAYIAARYLGGAEAADEEAQACAAALQAARAMLEAVRVCRRDTGRAVACRIGVSVGDVVVAVIGTLKVAEALLLNFQCPSRDSRDSRAVSLVLDSNFAPRSDASLSLRCSPCPSAHPDSASAPPAARAPLRPRLQRRRVARAVGPGQRRPRQLRRHGRPRPRRCGGGGRPRPRNTVVVVGRRGGGWGAGARDASVVKRLVDFDVGRRRAHWQRRRRGNGRRGRPGASRGAAVAGGGGVRRRC